MDGKIRVAVRSSDRLLREALTACLESSPVVSVVGMTSGMPDLAELSRLRTFDVAVVDLGGIDPTRKSEDMDEVRLRHPQLGIVIVYDSLAPSNVRRTCRIGVSALVPHARGLSEVVGAVLDFDRPSPSLRTWGRRLTERDLEILALMAVGYTVREIAALLEITPATVENHKRRIFGKLDVNSQAQALAKTTSLGIIGPGSRTLRITAHPAAFRGSLTPRELDIVRSIGRGESIRQTASVLDISTKTVENTQARLFRKLGVHNRAQALIVAHDYGLIPPSEET
jgi:DNA-binding NarL/FixJ family response regulator